MASAAGCGATFHFVVRMEARAARAVPSGERSGPAAGGLKILLAEDNALHQRLAVRLLEKAGHRVLAYPLTSPNSQKLCASASLRENLLPTPLAPEKSSLLYESVH
jgi:hypothetical protein